VGAETAPAQPPAGGLRRVARTVLWPLRRFFDPRFVGVHNALVELKRLLITDMEAANETATLTGRTLDRLLAQNEQILERLRAGEADGGATAWESAAIAYAFRALGAVPPGSSIAVVGAHETWVPAALESLGYDVTTDHGLRSAHREGDFDAVLVLAAPDLEERLRTLRRVTKRNGLLVLAVEEPHRGRLDEILRGDERTDVTELDGGVTLVTATKR
jgi:hypothetical protein